jgi:hypothetical protein
MAAGIPLVHPDSGGTFLAVNQTQAAALARKGWKPAAEATVEAAPAPARHPRPPAPTPAPEA